MWRIKPCEAIVASAEATPLHRTLGPAHLMFLGIGSVIGTGIFVLTAEAAQRAGPAMMISFVIAAFVCAVTALCYAELAAMIPVSGSAYTYAYGVLGEPLAWMIGWALALEYMLAGSAVAVGWSGYIVGLLKHSGGISVPALLANGPYAGGLINLPAFVVSIAVTVLLVVGTRESATFNAVLVLVKIAALILFVVLAAPAVRESNLTPFMPLGLNGVAAAASSIFFAYAGFDAVSTAAEETRNPQRDLPIAIVGTLLICAILYLLVAAGAAGAYGAHPVLGRHGEAMSPGSLELARRCAAYGSAARAPLPCSHEALAQVLRGLGYSRFAGLTGLAAGTALPSVILMMIFGQSRVFFVMARDGLIPEVFARTHRRFGTPYAITVVMGGTVAVAAAFLPVGQLANFANSGTLFSFFMVSLAVLLLRRTEPEMARPFRVPCIRIVAPLAMLGCGGLFLFLPTAARIVFLAWSLCGSAVYLGYGMRHSRLASAA